MNMVRAYSSRTFAVACLSVTLLSGLPYDVLLAQGSLTPPGPPQPTMKTLSEIEPRRLISALPYVITAGGSYYVATNLDGISGTNGITIEADHVALNLNGFVLRGVPGSGNGIAVLGERRNISIQNGIVRGWGVNGITTPPQTGVSLENIRLGANGNGFGAINVGGHSRVIGCSVEFHPGWGIAVGQNSLVSGCTTRGNGDSGIITAFGCTVQNCIVSSNFYGVDVGSGSTISGCIVSDSLSFGISTGFDCVVKDCIVMRSGGVGIATGGRSMVIGCTANQGTSISFGGINVGEGSLVKDCTASRNNRDGIRLATRCHAIGNTCSENGVGTNAAAGIITGQAGSRIESNHLVSNDWGLSAGTGNLIIKNSATGNGTNYLILGGTVGPIITTTGTITNTNPWANFAF